MERIAHGFTLAEAPTTTVNGHLLVSDVLSGGVRRFGVDGRELPPLLERRRGIGGMAVRAGGSVVVTGRDLATVDADGTLDTIAEQPDGGTGFNDIAASRDGTLVAGVLTCHPMSGGALTPALLSILDPSGADTTLELAFAWPNGIGFSPDESVLYVADFDRGVIHASPWHPGEHPEAGIALRPWASSPTGDADGLVVSPDGDLWVAGGAGGVLLHFDPSGQLIDQLEVPDDFVSSCTHWPDPHHLAITTGTAVFVHEVR